MKTVSKHVSRSVRVSKTMSEERLWEVRQQANQRENE